MDLIVLRFIMFTLILVIAYFFFLTIFEKKKNLKLNIINRLKEFDKYSLYELLERYLKRRGFEYLSITMYIFIKLICAAFFLIICELVGLYITGAVAALIGFFLIDIIIYLKDRGDKKEIDFQLGSVYSMLEIQMTSGVFIGDALSSAYLVVSNERLKEQLAVLSATISITKNIFTALENFKDKFNSQSIDNFVMVIEQGLQTGKFGKDFAGLAKKMADIREAEMEEQLRNVQDKADILGIAIFLGIVFIAFYLCSSLLFNTWSNTNL